MVSLESENTSLSESVKFLNFQWWYDSSREQEIYWNIFLNYFSSETQKGIIRKQGFRLQVIPWCIHMYMQIYTHTHAYIEWKDPAELILSPLYYLIAFILSSVSCFLFVSLFFSLSLSPRSSLRESFRVFTL